MASPFESNLTTFRVGGSAPFVLDLDRRELRREGEGVRMTSKPFNTLAFLVESRGQLVTLDKLRAAVWEGRSVSEPVIEHAVNKIRRSLGDNPANSRFMQTHWGAGSLRRLARAPAASPPNALDKHPD